MYHRLQQLWSAVWGRVSAAEEAFVAQLLPACELPLYTRMPRRDRRHCLDVYYTLVKAGIDDPLILRAALFHDTGKVDASGRAVPLVWYGGCVILKRWFPRSYALLAASPRGFRRWIHQYAHHGPIGARMALAAGSPTAIGAMLQHYHDDNPCGRAAVLQWADQQH